MNRFLKQSLVLAALIVVGVAGTVPLFAAKKFISIGTGGPTGVYFIAGNQICQLLNRAANKAAEAGGEALRCSAPASGGSIYNINALRAGDFDFGVVQSDWQHHAFNGTSKFEGQKFSDLRSVFSLHAEVANVGQRDFGWIVFSGLQTVLGRVDD